MDTHATTGNGHERLTETDEVHGGMNMAVIGTISVMSAILVLSSVLLIQGWFYRVQSSERARKDSGQANQKLVDLQQSQAAHLKEYRWVDQAAGKATIPIDVAMKRVVEKNGAE